VEIKIGDLLSAIPLGYGCIYNHSIYPNATWTCDIDHCKIIFKAIKDITKGEEIFTYYSDMWFELRGMEEREFTSLTKQRTKNRLFSTLVKVGWFVIFLFILKLWLLNGRV